MEGSVTRVYRPGQFKNSAKARELRKKVQAITRACSRDIPALINTGLAKLYLKLDDFVKTSPSMKKTFPQQILWRQETRLLFRPACGSSAAGAKSEAKPEAVSEAEPGATPRPAPGPTPEPASKQIPEGASFPLSPPSPPASTPGTAGTAGTTCTAGDPATPGHPDGPHVSEPAGPVKMATPAAADTPATPRSPQLSPPPVSTAITRETLLAFKGTDPESIVVAAEPVPEVHELYMTVEAMADEFIDDLEELQVHVTSLLPQETQSGADSGNISGLYEILEDIMRALTATSKIYETFTTYHTERAQLVKLVRKHGAWDFYQALLLHDSRCLSDLRVYTNDLCNNVCAMYDMLRKSEDVLRKPSASAVHKIMF